jgi:hypothetical protein
MAGALLKPRTLRYLRLADHHWACCASGLHQRAGHSVVCVTALFGLCIHMAGYCNVDVSIPIPTYIFYGREFHHSRPNQNSCKAVSELPPPPVAWILYLYPIKGKHEVDEGLGGGGQRDVIKSVKC